MTTADVRLARDDVRQRLSGAIERGLQPAPHQPTGFLRSRSVHESLPRQVAIRLAGNLLGREIDA